MHHMIFFFLRSVNGLLILKVVLSLFMCNTFVQVATSLPSFWQNIVADMRKVLAKNPQVEQQRLHRRVFLDNIDPENQALRVSNSFVIRIAPLLCIVHVHL